MRKNTIVHITLLIITCHLAYTQVKVGGTVKGSNDESLIGAHISLQPKGYFGITDTNGFFEIKDVLPGKYNITITHLGSKTYLDSINVSNEEFSLSVTLDNDLLNLKSVVVTGTFEPRTQLESNTAITILRPKELAKAFPRGTADLLQNIPGTFTDPSAGEVFTRVYTRGVSASVEDDLGWYYVSLQEDGLPVSLVQHSFYSPDLFHRTDLTTKKVEAIRGGNATVTALNGPGAIFNFISHGQYDHLNGEFSVLGGSQGEENSMFRIDGTLGGAIGKGWYYNAGGHYRRDEGARNVDFTFSKGGQLRFNVIKNNNNGYFKLYGKFLDDFTNRYTGVAAQNWGSPHAAFGQDFNTTALMLPQFSTNIPDGRNLSNGSVNSFDPSRGVHAEEIALGIKTFQELKNEWKLNMNVKYSDKNADWQTSQGNSLISLNAPIGYFASGAVFPIGQVVFRDAISGEEVSRINNSGILTGGTFEYLTEGRLPNDAIMGALPWFKKNESKEWIGRVSIQKRIHNHNLSFGVAGGFSNTSVFTQASFAYVTYEPSPRMLEVTLENPGQPIIALSDSNGVSNYGGLFYGNSEADINQLAFFASDHWKLTDKVHLDVGLRFETITHKGNNDRFESIESMQLIGGLDNNPNTAYDNEILFSTGEKDNFDFTYNYLSFSAGINYKFTDESAVFTRFSSGNKAPELNYYFNNFSNVPINQAGEIQKIQQVELGLKHSRKNFSSTLTAFWSELNNVGFIDFEFDADDGTIFYAPVQFNDSRTMGLELEGAYTLTSYITLRMSGTLQDAEATQWTVYNASGTVNTDDDFVVDFSGNKLPYNPNLMLSATAELEKNRLNAFFKWQFMGEREANVANGFQLPDYSIFNLGLGYEISSKLRANFLMTNVFNSEGLANFLGVNSIGSNINDVTPAFVQQNPDAGFIVVPVLPRGAVLKLNYRF
ncbi:TonB-dependent receptor [Aquimarina sp. 2304DJ70-9]|uniref:TonB-dependent receptor n=1 Tax=Aquimarina penaris TaxID=3231044 RepID=UPI00346356DF